MADGTSHHRRVQIQAITLRGGCHSDSRALDGALSQLIEPFLCSFSDVQAVQHTSWIHFGLSCTQYAQVLRGANCLMAPTGGR